MDRKSKLILLSCVGLFLVGLSCRLPFSSPDTPMLPKILSPTIEVTTPTQQTHLPTITLEPVLSGTPEDILQGVGQFQLVTPGEGLPEGEITSLFVDSNGRLYLSGTQGFYMLYDKHWAILYDGLVDRILGEDDAGRIWTLLDEGERIASHDGITVTVYDQSQGWFKPSAINYLSHGFGDGLVTDLQGRIWLATGRNDVRRFDPDIGEWTSFSAEDIGFQPPEEPGYQGHFLTDVALSNAGNVWVSDCIGMGEALEGQGIRRFDGKKWRDLADTAGECVYDMEVDADGRIWAGGFDALLQYSPVSDSWTRFSLPPWERRQIVASIELDENGNPWIEIIRYGGASIEGATARYHLFSGQWVLDLDPQIWVESDLGFGKQGKVWLCTMGLDGATIYRLADGQVEQFGLLDVYSYTCQIEVDGTGRVWIASIMGGDEGLWWFEP